MRRFTAQRSRHSTAVVDELLWTSDHDALSLLESCGGPFERRTYRRAVVAAMPNCRDVSFGAVAPDGTTAAIALIGRHRSADSVPPSGYGGIQSSRPLSTREAQAFVRAARRAAGAAALTARGLLLDDSRATGRRFAVASVVDVRRDRDYSRLARRSLQRAERAGASVWRSQDHVPFLDLYHSASARWAVRYPDALIARIASTGAGTFHHVEIGGEVVSSMFTLVEGTHWMCWLAAQNEEGRAVSASYAAYDAVFEDAQSAVDLVNLGASAPGSGGRQFKGYLGAREVPMVSWHDAIAGWSTAQGVTLLARRTAAGALRRARRFS
jgi:hypothetical protein